MTRSKKDGSVDGGPKPFDSAKVFAGGPKDSPGGIAEKKKNWQIDEPENPFPRAQSFDGSNAQEKPEACTSKKGGACDDLARPTEIKSAGGKEKEKQRPGQTRAGLVKERKTKRGARTWQSSGGWIQAWAGRRGRTRIRLSRAGPSGLTVSTWGSSRNAWWMIRRS